MYFIKYFEKLIRRRSKMATVKEVRERCDELRSNRREELKSVLGDYFVSEFILTHKPWRAVIGNRKCRPIPIHRSFYFSEEENQSWKFLWPEFSKEALRDELQNLGFVVSKYSLAISVPACEKRKKLTFAQEWVRKINHSYSKYCANEKKEAKKLYSEMLSTMCSTPAEKVKTYEEYTLFCELTLGCVTSPKCATFISKMMADDGIEEHYDDKTGEYKGIRVLQSQSN